MATGTRKTCCAACGKDAIFKCEGCLQSFCHPHVSDHRQELNAQLDEIEDNRNRFWQTLLGKTTEPHKNALIQQINTWENDSIQKIRKTADEIRQILLRHAEEHINPIESELNRLTDQLRRSREECSFIETDLQQWKEELIQLSDEFAETPNITIKEHSTPLVTTVQVDISGKNMFDILIDESDNY